MENKKINFELIGGVLELNSALDRLYQNNDFLRVFKYFNDDLKDLSIDMYRAKSISADDLRINLQTSDEFVGNIRGIRKSAREYLASLREINRAELTAEENKKVDELLSKYGN